jgi:hypothetical protein
LLPLLPLPLLLRRLCAPPLPLLVLHPRCRYQVWYIVQHPYLSIYKFVNSTVLLCLEDETATSVKLVEE